MSATSTPNPLPSSREVFRRSTLASLSVVARELQEVLGQRLAALVIGSGDPKALGRYVTGDQEPRDETAQRMRNAHLVVLTLRDANLAPDAIQAWFRGMNPDLDDESPARVILEHPKRVLEAARDFALEG